MDFETALEKLPDGRARFSCCTTSRATSTTRSRRCWRSRPGTSKAQLHRARMMLRRHLRPGVARPRGQQMTTDAFTDRLSDYIDDEITGAERAAIEAHLATCARLPCRVEELRSVVASRGVARGRPAAPQPVAGHRGAPGGRACGRAIAASGGSSRRGDSRSRCRSLPPPAWQSCCCRAAWCGWRGPAIRGRDFEPVSAETPSEPAPVRWHRRDCSDHAVQRGGGRSGTGARGRTRRELDPATVRILEENSASIDRAIDQSRRALAADPANSI